MVKVHKAVLFSAELRNRWKTGPSFSFGAGEGREHRTEEAQFLEGG